LTLSVEAGSPYTLGFSHIVNSLVKHILKKHKEAKDHLGEVFDIALQIKAKIYEFSALLLEALFAFDQGEEESGRLSLRKALALGKGRKYFYPYIDLPGRMAYLCKNALENGIEVEYVQELIRRLNIVSDQPPLHLENWPWRLRIYTLGRFELLRDGKPIQFSRKAQQKPLSLVKALVALGGMEVKEEQITDILWPEADGDGAHRSFEITLYRLRKLVGIHDVVQLQEGRLTLDPRYCWVDVWAFDDFLRRFEQGLQGEGKKIGETAAISQIQRAIGLYQGAFLPGETSEPWTNSVRERVRSKFLRCVKKLGHHWEKAGRREKAVECFQKGLEVDDLIEEFYQSLMTLYQRMGRRTEALSVYHRCQKALSLALGVDPSPEIESIRRSLLVDKKS